MSELDLNALSLKDLKQLQKDIAKAISGFGDRKKAEARVALEARARELGFSLSDLAGVEVKAKRNPAAAKYQNPENPTVTWSGRGRRPLWFTEAIAAGRKAEDLLVG